ncbi:hypothetical protein HKX48_008766 [Thoreauomyces humboldtii]|nr:hypothetical protein HKX48_008766 [Thoreauomyces humboldtii]
MDQFPTINVVAPCVLTIVVAAFFLLAVYNMSKTKIYALGWVMLYCVLRAVAFIFRIVVRHEPQSTSDEIQHKTSLLIVDSVLYTAGYFFLFNCTLGLVIRWLDPSASIGQGSVTTRILRYIHLGVIVATALSTYGGLLLASSPVTQDDIDKSHLYRRIGVGLMELVCLVMFLVLFSHTYVQRSKQPLLRRSATFLALCVVFCAVRAGLSLYFVNNQTAIVDEKFLYGLAIVPELPLLALLSFTPCLRWFEYHPDVRAALGHYTWVPSIISRRLDRLAPGWKGQQQSNHSFDSNPDNGRPGKTFPQQPPYTTYSTNAYPMQNQNPQHQGY